MNTPSQGLMERLTAKPLVRIVGYYLLLGLGLAALYRIAPDLPGVFGPGRFKEATGDGGSFNSGAGLSSIGAIEAAREAIIAMVGTYLLMLPVAWIYILTRQKRGYQQSLVQTLIVLPIVTSGVVILIKTSVALAFSLGGIVGAISFRNRVDDTKDAIQIFLAIGVGVACGVQVMSVALALSLFYNVINVLLWWTDFGRVPAAFEGPPAQKRLAQLRAAQARKTGAFVSQVDSMLLKSMTPEQLEVVVERARRRKQRFSAEIGLQSTGELRQPKFDGTLRMLVPGGDVDGLRRDVELILAGQAKFWMLEAVTAADVGRQTVLYRVRLKKSISASHLLEAVRRGLAGRAISVEFD